MRVRKIFLVSLLGLLNSKMVFAQEEQPQEPLSSSQPPPVPESDGPRNKFKEQDHRVYGSYKIRVGLAKPTFNDGLKGYDTLYGKTNYYPMFGSDWTPFDGYVGVGLSFRFGYYSAKGYASKLKEGTSAGSISDIQSLDESNLEKDTTSSTELGVYPLQGLIHFSFTPFWDRKWAVLSGWAGMERFYYQEELLSKDASAATTSRVVAKGKREAMIFGAELALAMNWLDESTVHALKNPLGIGFVYAAPFFQTIKAQAAKGPSFGRTEFGVSFNFESIR